MTSVFKKLIRNEFGENCYNSYFDYFHKNQNEKAVDNKEVFDDIYLKLKSEDAQTIMRMQERLNDTLLLAFRISKNYILAFVAYLFAILFMFVMDLHPAVLVPATFLVSVSFVVKTYEFIVNKYCYIDARIILVYKAVLEVLMIGKR